MYTSAQQDGIIERPVDGHGKAIVLAIEGYWVSDDVASNKFLITYWINSWNMVSDGRVLTGG